MTLAQNILAGICATGDNGATTEQTIAAINAVLAQQVCDDGDDAILEEAMRYYCAHPDTDAEDLQEAWNHFRIRCALEREARDALKAIVGYLVRTRGQSSYCRIVGCDFQTSDTEEYNQPHSADCPVPRAQAALGGK